jgi:hypothetical protein
MRIDADRETSRLNEDFRKRYEGLRFADDGWDLEAMRPAAAALAGRVRSLRAGAAAYVTAHPFATF